MILTDMFEKGLGVGPVPQSSNESWTSDWSVTINRKVRWLGIETLQTTRSSWLQLTRAKSMVWMLTASIPRTWSKSSTFRSATDVDASLRAQEVSAHENIDHLTVITHWGPDIVRRGTKLFGWVRRQKTRVKMNRAVIIQLYYIMIY